MDIIETTSLAGEPVIFIGETDEFETTGVCVGPFRMSKSGSSLCFNTHFFSTFGYLDTFGWRVGSGYINPPMIKLAGGRWKSQITLSKKLSAAVEKGVRFYLGKHPEIELETPLRESPISKPAK